MEVPSGVIGQLNMPVKVAAHKVVPVEETTVMLRDLGIGANAVCKDKKEQGADAECEDGVGACPRVFNGSATTI